LRLTDWCFLVSGAFLATDLSLIALEPPLAVSPIELRRPSSSGNLSYALCSASWRLQIPLSILSSCLAALHFPRLFGLPSFLGVLVVWFNPQPPGGVVLPTTTG